MPDLTHSERYYRLDQVIQILAEGQQSLEKLVASLANDNDARGRQFDERSLTIDQRIDELLIANAKINRLKN